MAEHLDGMRDPAHDRLDFDHLNFAEAIDLAETFRTALKAIAVDGTNYQLDKIALLYGRALSRQQAAFREFERERDSLGRKLKIREESHDD